MKLHINQDRIQTLLKVGLFLCTIVLIIQMFPRQESFEYKFNVGKPWSYELVTAPFDYPIYKEKALYEKEKGDMLQNFAPYFYLDYRISATEVNDFLIQSENGKTPQVYLAYPYKKYISDCLNYVYKQGIINSDELALIKENKQQYIKIIDNKKYAHKTSIDSIFTVKSAYEFIIKNKPAHLNEDILKSANLNAYLSENLLYNKVLSLKEMDDMLGLVSQTSGMVQAGQRIVDRGEIITDKTSGLLNSLNIELKKQKTSAQQYNLMWLGQIVLLLTMMTMFFLYLYLFRKNIYGRKKHIFFLMIMMLMMVGLAVVALKIPNLSIYIVPFAMLPVIVRIFFDSRTAMFMHIITILLISLIVPNSFEFLLLQIMVGMTVVSSLKDLTQRSQLFWAAVLVFVTYSVMYVGFCLLIEGDINRLDTHNFLFFGINAFLLLFAYGLIYIFEKLFGFLSNVTLVELSNVNSPLLLQLSEVAPGTFQHSLQVANLVTEAGKRINANTLLLRVGALYHDIGKLSNPLFFTENQLSDNNPLSDLDYEVAAQHIINHVTEGVKIAERNGLPGRIVDFIRTHHGKSRTRYFYNSFINKYPDRKVNEASFIYDGPSPKTKEQALLMIADAVEASSRSLSEYSDETINLLVDTIVNKQIADGLLKDAKITFVDVEIVKEVLKEKLKTIYHTRVSYPELLKKAETPKTEEDFDY